MDKRIALLLEGTSQVSEAEGDATVTWTDRDYKSYKKVFKNDPKGVTRECQE